MCLFLLRNILDASCSRRKWTGHAFLKRQPPSCKTEKEEEIKHARHPCPFATLVRGCEVVAGLLATKAVYEKVEEMLAPGK